MLLTLLTSYLLIFSLTLPPHMTLPFTNTHVGPELSSRCCGPRGVPPNIQAERNRLLYLSNSSWICCASSRVGVKNSAIGLQDASQGDSAA